MLVNDAENAEKAPTEAEAVDQPSFLRQAVVGERMHLQIPSRVDWVEMTVMHLADKAKALGVCDAQRHGKLVTALTEALTNAIVHGNLGIPSSLKETPGAFTRMLAERSNDPAYSERPVDIEMCYDGQHCRWTITDRGAGFDVQQVLQKLDTDPDPDSPDFDPVAALCSGRGIMLMRVLVDEVSWSPDGRRVSLVMHRTTKDDRRTTVRHPSIEPVRMAPVDDTGRPDWDRAFDGLATNVSAGGMGILNRGLSDGQVQRMVIEVEVDGRRVYVPAEVCHIKPVGLPEDGMVQIGCRFAPQPQTQPGPADAGMAEALDALIGRLVDSRVTEPLEHHQFRQQPRVVYTRPVRLVLHDGREVPAVARDLSKSGIAFVTDFPLERGGLLGIILEPGTDAAVRLHAQVMRCNKMAGAYHDIGCRFSD